MESKVNDAANKIMKTNVANLQLTKIMEQILQMLQKNSIHMDLSDEDIARLERQEQRILDSLEQLRIQADENRKRVHRIFDEKKVLCDQLTANLPGLYVHMEILKQKNNEQESIYEGRKSLYDTYYASYISKQEAYSKAQENLESARRKAKKQKKLLKKWFWVPGYGAYLAFDKLLNDQEADADAASREYYAARERLEAINRDLESVKHDVQCSQAEKNSVQKAYDEKLEEIKKIQGQLHQMKEEMVHWELILSEVNALYNKIKNASLGPDEIIAMQAELIQLQKL